MAMTLFQKAQLVVKSKLHALLDKEVNTIDGYTQLIRDLESAIADLGAGVDEAVGTGNGYQRKITELNSQIAEKLNGARLLAAPDDDPTNDKVNKAAALQLITEKQQLEGQLSNYQNLLTAQETQTAQLQQALKQLQDRHAEMLVKRDELAQTQAIAQAKEKAASTIEAAADVLSDVGSVDSIEANLNHQGDVAAAHFDRAMGRLDSPQSPEAAVASVRANAEFDALRAEVTEQAAASVATDKASTTA